MGFDEVVGPIPAAIYDHLTTGIPFSQAYDQNVQAMRGARKAYETAHPWIGTAAELGGAIIPAVATSGLYGAAEAGAGLGTRALMLARNTGINAVQGAVAGGGMTEGDLGQRITGAGQGAVLGAGVGAAAAGLTKGVVGTYRALRPSAAVPRQAGQTLLDATGGRVPQVEPTPIPGMQRNVAQASNEPGLAATVRRSNALNDRAALEEAQANNAAVQRASTEMVGSGQHVGTRLASGRMTAPEASEKVVEGMQKAHDVIKQEEGRLWSQPAMSTKLNLPAVKQTVNRAITNMPVRFKNVLTKNADMQAALDELANLPKGTTLADLNTIRSDLLSLARTLPREQGMAKKVAGDLAKAILDGIEKNPALRNDPQAWSEYVAARAFTAKMWSVFGHDPMQAMLRANKFGNAGTDARTAAGRLFGFGKGTAGERIPGGVNAIGDMLDDVQSQWRALGGAGGLDPATANAARSELIQGTRDFIVNSMLDHAESATLDLSGEPNMIWNRVSGFVRRNAGWIKNSGLMNQDQLDLLDSIGEAAKQVARPENLRGGKGSETYERLMKDPTLISLFSNAYVRWGARAAGAGIGAALAHYFGETGIGAILGVGAEGLGEKMLQQFYAGSREQVRALVEQAIRDPDIAHDLMQKAASFKPNPKTIDWLRSIMAIELPGRFEQHRSTTPAYAQ